MPSRPRIAVSLGDPCGIGPEVTVRALADPELRQRLVPIVFGDPEVWRRATVVAGVDPGLPMIDRPPARTETPRDGAVVAVTRLSEQEAPWGGATDASGRAQLAYLATATAALAAGDADALCTAPITKAAVAAFEPGFTGHTEWLQARLGAKRVVMMLAGPQLRVALVTTHLALAEVPGRITSDAVEAAASIVDASLRGWFGVEHPRLAVCGLNPHAGEGGHFGREDQEQIEPAVRRLRASGIDAHGPLPADGALATAARGAWDAVLAMYHDQGLGAVKALHFDDAVNVTLGLPRPRTSPDHGSALDLAGTGKARPESMKAALRMAAELAERLRR